MTRNLLASAAILVALGCPVLAQEAAPGAAAGPSDQGSANTDNTGIVDGLKKTGDLAPGHAMALIGTEVVDSNGRDAGTVKDVVLDYGGRVEGVVVTVEKNKDVGVAGNKTFVTQKPSTKEEVVIVDMTREELAQLPGIVTRDRAVPSR